MAVRKQKLTYNGDSLLEGKNSFELSWGTRPSFGVFRCAKSVYEAWDTSGDFVGDLVFSDGERSVTLQQIHLVRADFDSTTNSYTIILADRRIVWQNTYGTKDYNIYSSGALNTDDGNEYEISPDSIDTSDSTNWTYDNLIDDLIPDEAIALPGSQTREPRNIRGVGRSLSDILQQLMYELNCFMVYDPVDDIFNVYQLGFIDPDDSQAIDENYETYTHHKLDISPGGVWKPKTIKAYYMDKNGKWTVKSAAVTGGVIGERGYYTAYTDSTNGQAYTQEFATELATNFGDAALWRDQTFAGIQPIVPSTEAHIITWTSGPDGSFTRIRREFPQSIPDPVPTSLFASNGFISPIKTLFVDLTQTGGSAGDSTTQCTFTYTLKVHGSSTTLAEGIGLAGSRPIICTMIAASVGLAAVDTDGTWIILWCDERMDQTVCADS